MSLPISSISAVCRSIADFISTGLEASSHSIRTLIGNPIDALPGQSDTDHRINLFFTDWSRPDFSLIPIRAGRGGFGCTA